MKPYKFSKLWLFFVKKISNKILSRWVAISGIICAIGLILYYAISKDFIWLVVFPFGFPVMTVVFLKTAVIWYNDFRVVRYCKKNKITFSEFETMYQDKI